MNSPFKAVSQIPKIYLPCLERKEYLEPETELTAEELGQKKKGGIQGSDRLCMNPLHRLNKAGMFFNFYSVLCFTGVST